jgi:hypothetical protein
MQGTPKQPTNQAPEAAAEADVGNWSVQQQQRSEQPAIKELQKQILPKSNPV